MRYVILNEDRIIINIIEVFSAKAAQFDAHYLGDNHLEIGDVYPVIEMHPVTQDELTQQAITDLYIADIERGQEATALLLDQIAQGQDITDIQITLLEGKA